MRNRTRTSATFHSGALERLRRVVVFAVMLGLGTVAAGAAIVTAISITTTRTMDAFRNADPAMVQAQAWTEPGGFVVASRAHRLTDIADVTNSIPPTHATTQMRVAAAVPNRIRKTDRLPVRAPVAELQLSAPQTVAAARHDAAPEIAKTPITNTRALAYAPEPPVTTGSIATMPIVAPTKKYVLASVAPVAPEPVVPVAPASLATPLPLSRPADAPHGSDDDAADADSRTAVYVIAASTVHMPDGTKLVAHSGLGRYFNNPRYTKVKNKGPTPPNVYRLTMRKRLFHGVRAVRLNPVFEDKMYGRDGMLAHSYLLGGKGESNGCVSFKDYPKFLQAFRDGKVDRMVVVPDLKSESLRIARARGRQADRYASNN